MKMIYTEKQLNDILDWKSNNIEWKEMVKRFNKKYKVETTVDSLKSKFYSFKDKNLIRADDVQKDSPSELFAILKESNKEKAKSKKVLSRNKILTEYLISKEDILDGIKDVLKTSKIKALKINKPKLKSTNKGMTLELLVSDVHFGKKTDTFNLKVAKERLTTMADTVVGEVSRNQKNYNIDRIILALLGDIIESSTMHGLESAKGSEFGNAKQIQVAIENLFYSLIMPIAKLGIPITLPCITGNHDRTEMDRTMTLPGLDNVTWIIYNALKLLAKAHNLNHLEFIIPEKSYLIMSIYKNNVLYEHGDNRTIKSPTRPNLESFMNKRGFQVKKVVDFFRLGHFHEPVLYGQGRIIVNGSVVGNDSYAEVLGFSTDAVQILNFYINTKDRPTCFYKSFPIYLK